MIKKNANYFTFLKKVKKIEKDLKFLLRLHE